MGVMGTERIKTINDEIASLQTLVCERNNDERLMLLIKDIINKQTQIFAELKSNLTTITGTERTMYVKFNKVIKWRCGVDVEKCRGYTDYYEEGDLLVCVKQIDDNCDYLYGVSEFRGEEFNVKLRRFIVVEKFWIV
jgi:hypothetical protein